jgi:hypothetical protein
MWGLGEPADNGPTRFFEENVLGRVYALSREGLAAAEQEPREADNHERDRRKLRNLYDRAGR